MTRITADDQRKAAILTEALHAVEEVIQLRAENEIEEIEFFANLGEALVELGEIKMRQMTGRIDDAA